MKQQDGSIQPESKRFAKQHFQHRDPVSYATLYKTTEPCTSLKTFLKPRLEAMASRDPLTRHEGNLLGKGVNHGPRCVQDVQLVGVAPDGVHLAMEVLYCRDIRLAA